MKALLPPAYTVKERGKVTVKGKGEMITFWVESKANRIPPAKEEVLNLFNIYTISFFRVFIYKSYDVLTTLRLCILNLHYCTSKMRTLNQENV